MMCTCFLTDSVYIVLDLEHTFISTSFLNGSLLLRFGLPQHVLVLEVILGV